ncbi:MAG: TIGR03986 family CRISPR-associated RAMP protein [Chloroflexi bacterium]|nr:TIGR03986 family CRISPR-associated RAMP protein [Chloroflexota bacterium]
MKIEKPKPREEPRQQQGPYRFLNPYNFVRTLEVRNRTAAPLLGRCSPPPHDRYVGISGRITCQLTAVTPLFVSDSEGITEESVGEKIHSHYRFFRDPEGNVAIPATSLRGSIRSIFEAATNSCFANFAGDKRLSYHLPPGDALRLVPARVRKVNDDRWELDLLPGTTSVNPTQRPAGPQYAAWVPTYTPLWASRTTAKAPKSPYSARQKVSLAGFSHGEPCQAIVESVQHPLRRFEFWNVVHLAQQGQRLPNPKSNQRIVSGYLCITNQNIENKHDERLFFNTQQLKPVELPSTVRQKYEELIADYQERHGDEAHKRKQPTKPHGKEPAFSRFIVERTGKKEPKLVDGDLVYAMLERNLGGFGVQFIVPVSVPRVGFNRTIGELLYPGELGKCDKYDHLCPACRTFGWVWGAEDRDIAAPALAERTAYAGRVRFSHANLTHDAGAFDSTLAILSTPKPTTARFYLRPKAGKPQDGLPDHQTDFDASGQILRGRKVYRHHGDRLNPQEYQSVNGAKSDQNRTVHGVQDVGSVFEFTVDFENLAAVELGALLWSLSLEGWHHRLGFGKPLGFGSAKVDVIAVNVLSNADRYATLTDETGGWANQTSEAHRWILTFKEAMQARYGMPFEKLDTIRDLKALLAETLPLPVHYPRPTANPQAEGKQYEWFVGNKRSGQDAGSRLALRLADEDREGLPLIDKYGDQKS